MSALVEAALRDEPKLHIGDVIYSPRARRYLVVGWSPRGKIVLRSALGREYSYWWTTPKDLPKRWKVFRLWADAR